MVDQNLLVSAEELPAKSHVPFIMEEKPVMGQRFSIYGFFENEGPRQNRRGEVFNDRGEKVCTGEYSLSIFQAFLGSGDFKLNCFDNKLVGQGSFSVKVHGGRKHRDSLACKLARSRRRACHYV